MLLCLKISQPELFNKMKGYIDCLNYCVQMRKEK